MGDFLRAVFLGLVPPDLDAEPKLKQRWCVNISITVGVLLMGLIGSTALAFGFATAFFPGFAQASDVTDMKKISTEIRVSQLDTEIFEAHEKECEALVARNRELAVQYEQRVQTKLPVYQQLSGLRYQLQSCPNF